MTHNRPTTDCALRRIVIITPMRNEAEHLEKTIASVVSQSLRPKLWILVDDGSTDATPRIAARAAAQHSWIRVVTRSDRGRRVLGGGVIRAFHDGLAEVEVEYDYLGKLDADMSFGEHYLETLVAAFERDPILGAASGKVYRPEGDELVEEFMIDDMVAGQFKLYRRACFREIGGLVEAVMWDGIDFHRARQEGWRTRSIDWPELRLVHHRLMGSSDRSVFRGRVRWGLGQWFLGSHVLYVACSALFRMRERPYVVGGALILWGYLLGGLRREPRFEHPGFRDNLRKWQQKRLHALIWNGEVR